jgi:hypothetical protein
MCSQFSRDGQTDRGGIMGRIVLIPIVAVVLTVGPGPASADWLSGPIEVMRPDGTVFRIESPSVAAWWRDYRRARCASCTGSNREALEGAARLLYTVERALGTRYRTAPRYLILPDVLQLDWPYAWVFYPSTDRTPAYLVKHGGISAGGAPLQWDVWYPATDRMEQMILEGAADVSSSALDGAVDESRTTRSAPSSWPILAGVSAAVLLLAAGGYVWRRRVR